MGYKSFVSMNIAIMGAGKKSESLARSLASAGHEIFMGLKNYDNPISYYLRDAYENINITSVEQAAAMADIIIIATPLDEVRKTAYLLDDVRRKVVIDITSSVSVRSEDYLNSLNAIRSITGSVHVVKCLNCKGYENLISPLFQNKIIDMLVVGESKKAKEIVKIISKDLGLENIYDFGDNDATLLMDEMAKCWHNIAVRQKMGRKITFKVEKL